MAVSRMRIRKRLNSSICCIYTVLGFQRHYLTYSFHTCVLENCLTALYAVTYIVLGFQHHSLTWPSQQCALENSAICCYLYRASLPALFSDLDVSRMRIGKRPSEKSCVLRDPAVNKRIVSFSSKETHVNPLTWAEGYSNGVQQ
jgi:hypothetical protein